MAENVNELIPETRKSSTFFVLAAITLFVTVLYVAGMDFPYWLELSIFALFVILTGIPHGAVDHIVAADVYELTRTFSDQVKFFGIYLLTMLLLGIVWILSPVSGFAIFILISIFHFGQGDLHWMTRKVGLFRSRLLYISRGVMLLTVPVIYHWEITAPIIEAAAGFNLAAYTLITENALLLSVGAVVQHVVLMLFLVRQVPARYLLQELLLILLLAVMFFYAHPLVSFGIYFGIWHSLNHFYELRDHLKESESTSGFFELYKHTIPFTLISFSGLIFLWFLLGVTGSENQMISLLFILISVLTLPHMLLINQMYQTR